jgi:signal transduction histidine kinase
MGGSRIRAKQGPKRFATLERVAIDRSYDRSRDSALDLEDPADSPDCRIDQDDSTQPESAPATGRLNLSWINRLSGMGKRGPSGRSANETSHTHVNLPAVVVFLVGLGLTVAAFYVTRDLYRSVAEQEFDRQASHYVLALRKATDRHLELMDSAADLFGGTERIAGRWDLFTFAKDRLAYYPGLRALGWVPIVPESEREAYVRRAEADGLRGFSFSEITGTSVTVPAARRRYHLPLYFIEPYDGNEDLLGLDLASMPEIRAALQQTNRDGRLNVIEWKDPRGQPYRNGKTLLLVQPVFAPDAALGNKNITGPEGYIVGLVRLDLLFGTTLREFTTPAWLDTYLYEDNGGISNKLVHVEPSVLRTSDMAPPADEEIDAGFAAMAGQKIGNRGYSIVVRPVPGTMDFDLGAVPWGVALFGLALTLLLTRYMVVSRYKQQQIETAVVQRTAELSRANRSNLRMEKEILERKRVEAELRTAKDEAEVASRAKSEFLAMVSHELRTPLNAVIGFSEMLTNEMFGPIGDGRYLGYAADIRSSGLHLLSLINDILDLSKVEANSFELSEEELDVPSLVDEALHLVEVKAEAGEIRLKPELPPDLPVLYADERAFKQIILNLLSNAVKFTPPGGRVSVSANVNDAGEFVFMVADTGIGIAEEDQKKVLKPFTQADSSLARRYEGTGLGLPLTKSLVELHGGRLELESLPQKGTTVRAAFPRDRVIQNSVAAE